MPTVREFLEVKGALRKLREETRYYNTHPGEKSPTATCPVDAYEVVLEFASRAYEGTRWWHGVLLIGEQNERRE